MIFANIFFDENVPEEIRSKVSALYKSSRIEENFLIEVPEENVLMIIAENGFVKNLPLSEITADDIFNLMEEMVAVVYEKQDKFEKAGKDSEEMARIRKLKSKWKDNELEVTMEGPSDGRKKNKPAGHFLKSGIKVTDNIEFFPWTGKKDRFGISLFTTSEERWAFGAKLSAGAAFLRFGFRFKKGINLKMADNSVPWESYGANFQIDVADIYGLRLSTGFEIALYSAKGVLFDREFFIFRLAYRIKWFEIAGSFNVSPNIIELGLFGSKHEMGRYNFMMSLVFLF